MILLGSTWIELRRVGLMATLTWRGFVVFPSGRDMDLIVFRILVNDSILIRVASGFFAGFNANRACYAV